MTGPLFLKKIYAIGAPRFKSTLSFAFSCAAGPPASIATAALDNMDTLPMDVALAAEPPATMPLEASPAHNPEEKRSAFQKPKGEVVEKPDEPKEKKTEKDEKDEKENINPKESEISPEIPSSGLYDDFTDSDKARG